MTFHIYGSLNVKYISCIYSCLIIVPG